MIRRYSRHDTLAATIARGTSPRLPSPPVETYSDGIDWIAVERVATDDRPLPELNPAEKRIAALLLAKAGRTEAETASMVGVTDRQVSRWKQAASGKTKTCKLEDCDEEVKALGLCNPHYQQHRRSQAPKTAKAPRTTCRSGLHAYPDCLATRPNGRPYCQPCDRAARKAYRDRKAGTGNVVTAIGQNLGRQQLGEAA